MNPQRDFQSWRDSKKLKSSFILFISTKIENVLSRRLGSAGLARAIRAAACWRVVEVTPAVLPVKSYKLPGTIGVPFSVQND